MLGDLDRGDGDFRDEVGHVLSRTFVMRALGARIRAFAFNGQWQAGVNHRLILGINPRTVMTVGTRAASAWRVERSRRQRSGLAEHALGEEQEIRPRSSRAQIRGPHRGVFRTDHLPGEAFGRNAGEFLRHGNRDATSAQEPLIGLHESLRRWASRPWRRRRQHIVRRSLDVPGKAASMATPTARP